MSNQNLYLWRGVCSARPYGAIGLYTEHFEREVRAANRENAIAAVIDAAHAVRMEAQHVRVARIDVK